MPGRVRDERPHTDRTALAEELILGPLFGLFKRNHSQWTALAMSSAVFGLWRITPTMDSIRTHPAGDKIADRPVRVAASVRRHRHR